MKNNTKGNNTMRTEEETQAMLKDITQELYQLYWTVKDINKLDHPVIDKAMENDTAVLRFGQPEKDGNFYLVIAETMKGVLGEAGVIGITPERTRELCPLTFTYMEVDNLDEVGFSGVNCDKEMSEKIIEVDFSDILAFAS